MSSIPNRRGFLKAAAAASAALMAGDAASAPPRSRGRLPTVPAARSATPTSASAAQGPINPGVWLPQDDPHPAARRRQLEQEQERYQYEYGYISPLAMLRNVPPRDAFSVEFLSVVGSRTLDLLENLIAQHGDARDLVRHRNRKRAFDQAAGASAANVPQLLATLESSIASRAAVGRPDSLDDYASLFRTIGLPPIAQDFQLDKVFAWMRVAGPNPLVLERIDLPDSRFPFDNEIYQQTLPDDSLLAAAAEGRLYLADYAVLDLVEAGSFPAGQKFVYAPLALFAVEKSTGDLVPVAIQCHQQPGPRNPIFTPRDGWSWLIAKTIVEIADANVHEMISHLGRTHLYLEPFGIATHRQLAHDHPLGVLMRPHFEGTFAINQAARNYLVMPGGPTDRLLCGTIEASRWLAAHGVQTWPFQQARPADTFRTRGVLDASALPAYPYRDDVLLYWSILRQWSESYVSLYYPRQSDLADDHELSNWAREIGSANGGRIPGFAPQGELTFEWLIDTVAQILFTASVQHAAVGYPQFDLMSYIPNMPLAGYRPAPTSRSGSTEQDFLDLLPPLEMANLQLAVMYELGTIQYTRLGEYAPRHFRDPRVAPLLASFQSELDAAGLIIQERNRHRRPYEFLAREGIPQSVNI